MRNWVQSFFHPKIPHHRTKSGKFARAMDHQSGVISVSHSSRYAQLLYLPGSGEPTWPRQLNPIYRICYKLYRGPHPETADTELLFAVSKVTHTGGISKAGSGMVRPNRLGIRLSKHLQERNRRRKANLSTPRLTSAYVQAVEHPAI